jgi:FAD/FMN-containing dehydrogenase
MKHDEIMSGRGGRFCEYGTANRISDSNLQPVLWCLSAWSMGAMGVLPWQTIGSKKCWDSAEQTALFYPRDNTVYPSVRLKAFTVGQQYVEYLALLGDVLDLTRSAVAEWFMNR